MRGEPLQNGAQLPEANLGWRIHIFTPTSHPLETLAVSLTRETESLTATTALMDDMTHESRSLRIYAQRIVNANPSARDPRLLLVIDQFEELFTLCRSDTERTCFLDNLLNASQGDGLTLVIIILRADFYAHCAQHTGLRQVLSSQQEYIGSMDYPELCRAIEQPALRNGWLFEPGLVDLILRDIGASEDHPPEPGALPLLEHALLETWHRRSGRTLTLKGYAEAGGVHGAIAHTAESVFAGLELEQQALAKRIFMRLTDLGEGTQDTRRRIKLDELMSGSADVERVLRAWQLPVWSPWLKVRRRRSRSPHP
jgi:hypothetical protein